ncbi:hypothetical protein HKX48_006403 [Thoreauomyces humboldtii]|nr:hypothetical protein HKX48_006403 [Thoreauomyces humboldtii]
MTRDDPSAPFGEAVTRHTELLNALSQTDHAPKKLKELDTWLRDLIPQQRLQDERSLKLSSIAQEERIFYESLKGASIRRFVSKFGIRGPEAKAARKAEEQEKIVTAAETSAQEARDAKEVLDTTIARALTDRVTFVKDAEMNEAARMELDSIHDALFANVDPVDTPEFEHPLRTLVEAKDRADLCRSLLDRDLQCMEMVGHASARMKDARRYIDLTIKRPSNSVGWDPTLQWGGSVVVEPELLRGCAQALASCNEWLDKARDLNPAIGYLPQVVLPYQHLATSSLLANIVVPGITSDLHYNQNVRNEDQVTNAHLQLKYILVAQDNVITHRKSDVARSTAELLVAQRTLQDVRARVFARFAGVDLPACYVETSKGAR